MCSVESAEDATLKQTNNLLSDRPGGNDLSGMGLENRSSRRLERRVRILYGVIVVLLILLLIATGLAIYFELKNRKSLKDQSQQGDDAATHDVTSETNRRRATKNVRLPHSVLPRHYNLKLQVHLHTGKPSEFFYNGSVDIDVFCNTQTDEFFVHAYKNLNVSKDQIRVTRLVDGVPTDEPMPITDITYDDDLQWYEIKLGEQFEPGKYYRISFGQFRAPLTAELKGWYLSSYRENGTKKYLATSQLQPTDARRVFPCWDEPALKAIFRITIIRHEDYHSLSNMHVERSEALPGGWYADVFYPTVNTTTYLLAFVVSQFASISELDHKGRNFTVWARPEVIHTARFALNLGKKIIKFYEEYFEVPYPLAKTDMIAVPDFSAGAMENWGLMIYRETTMLWDETSGTAESQQKVASVISHEIAHQWFGNLVTLTWWDDLWLNEGFASFAENLGVNHALPEWKMDEQFLLDDLQKVLISDASVHSRPVIQSVHYPNEINDIFDAISYNKGASLLRMLQDFMGEEAFRLGLKNYLSDFMFKNTVHDDLWNAMSNAARDSGKDLDIKSIMETWLLQMNYPLVSVERIGAKTFKVSQTRYVDPPDEEMSNTKSPFNFKWRVPLSYIDGKNRTGMFWLDVDSMTVDLDIDPTSWYIFNLRQAGFYRVQYTQDNWQALIDQFHVDHTVIPVHSRSQIIDDLFNLANHGDVPYNTFLDLTKYYSSEDSFIGWETAARTLRWLMRMFIMDPAYSTLLQYVQQLVERPLAKVDWEKYAESSDHLDNRFRSTVASIACLARHKNCLDRTRQIFYAWMANSSTNRIPPSLRTTVYCGAIMQGGDVEWNFLIDKMDQTNEDEEMYILHGLACTRDPWNIKEYLLRMKSRYQANALPDAAAILTSNPLGQVLLWGEMRRILKQTAHQTNSTGDSNKSMIVVPSMLNAISRPTYTMNGIAHPEEIEELKREIEALGRKHVFYKVIKACVKRAEQNHHWYKAHRSTIINWLKKQLSSQEAI